MHKKECHLDFPEPVEQVWTVEVKILTIMPENK